MKQYKRMSAILHFAVLALSAVAAGAAAERWTVRGTVVDQDNSLVQGTVVKIENRALQYIRSYITQEDGAFHFTGLNRDTDYSIRARKRETSEFTNILEPLQFAFEPTVTLRLRGLKSRTRPPQGK